MCPPPYYSYCRCPLPRHCPPLLPGLSEPAVAGGRIAPGSAVPLRVQLAAVEVAQPAPAAAAPEEPLQGLPAPGNECVKQNRRDLDLRVSSKVENNGFDPREVQISGRFFRSNSAVSRR